MQKSANAEIGHVQKYKKKNFTVLFLKMNRLHKKPSETWSTERLIINSHSKTSLILFDSFPNLDVVIQASVYCV